METTQFFRGYFYLTAYPSITTQVWDTWSNGGGAPSFHLYIKTDGTLAWAYEGGAIVASGTTPVPLSQWNLIETKQVENASTGGMEVKLNGVTEFSSFGTNTVHFSIPMRYWIFGPALGGGQTFSYDDMSRGTAGYIGAGASIARQGKAGTPTYDTWTKNNCATANECWSETPFSATKNATDSSASSAKQTMFIEAVTLPSATHGTARMAAHDTVNACVTAFVGKDSASGPISTMRRVSGVDTFNQSGISTSDQFFIGNTFTAATFSLTPDNLNNIEIGARGRAGASTTQVEDVWLLCDYTFVAQPIRHKVTQ